MYWNYRYYIGYRNFKCRSLAWLFLQFRSSFMCLVSGIRRSKTTRTGTMMQMMLGKRLWMTQTSSPRRSGSRVSTCSLTRQSDLGSMQPLLQVMMVRPTMETSGSLTLLTQLGLFFEAQYWVPCECVVLTLWAACKNKLWIGVPKSVT